MAIREIEIFGQSLATARGGGGETQTVGFSLLFALRAGAVDVE